MSFDSVVGAIGEQANFGMLEDAGLERDADGKWKDIDDVYIGGDAFRGPATVVESIADARRAAASILKKEKLDFAESEGNRYSHDKNRFAEIYEKKGKLLPASSSPKSEYLRCLECNSVCNKCVDVCPNRANLHVSVAEKDGFRNPWQILHLDALCNECGNCATFCPYDGLPYKDKLTLFSSKVDFDHSVNNGFYVSNTANNPMLHLRLDGVCWEQQATKGSENGERAKVLAIVNAVIRDYGYLLEAKCFF
jgi:putative selenate reductase